MWSGIANFWPHYRFDRYAQAVRIALRRTTFGTTGDGPIVHVDLGCGPGPFSWVVSDALRQNGNDIQLYGFDAREMIRLASDVWRELGGTRPCMWHDNIADLLSALDTTPPHRHRYARRPPVLWTRGRHSVFGRCMGDCPASAAGRCQQGRTSDIGPRLSVDTFWGSEITLVAWNHATQARTRGTPLAPKRAARFDHVSNCVGEVTH